MQNWRRCVYGVFRSDAKSNATSDFPIESSDYDNTEEGYSWKKIRSSLAHRRPPKAPQRTDATAVRTLPMDEVKRLIRKVPKDHEGLFRRLAK